MQRTLRFSNPRPVLSKTRPRLPSSLVAARCIHQSPSQAQASTSTSSSNPNDTSTDRTTHFGFQTVPEDAKESLVRNVFDSVVIVHPGGVTEEQIKAIKVPAAWACAERAYMYYSPDDQLGC